jgi:hypothetical protein
LCESVEKEVAWVSVELGPEKEEREGWERLIEVAADEAGCWRDC